MPRQCVLLLTATIAFASSTGGDSTPNTSQAVGNITVDPGDCPQSTPFEPGSAVMLQFYLQRTGVEDTTQSYLSGTCGAGSGASEQLFDWDDRNPDKAFGSSSQFFTTGSRPTEAVFVVLPCVTSREGAARQLLTYGEKFVLRRYGCPYTFLSCSSASCSLKYLAADTWPSCESYDPDSSSHQTTFVFTSATLAFRLHNKKPICSGDSVALYHSSSQTYFQKTGGSDISLERSLADASILILRSPTGGDDRGSERRQGIAPIKWDPKYTTYGPKDPSAAQDVGMYGRDYGMATSHIFWLRAKTHACPGYYTYMSTGEDCDFTLKSGPLSLGIVDKFGMAKNYARVMLMRFGCYHTDEFLRYGERVQAGAPPRTVP